MSPSTPPVLPAPDPDLAARYVAGAVSPSEAVRVEQAMDASPAWRALVGAQVPSERLDLGLTLIGLELDAPKRGVVERVMTKVGMPEHIARLMAATPVLRRSWYLASLVVLFFAISASDSTRDGATIAFFLALAPVVPVLGVGMAYGPGIDPAHDMTVATPLSGFRLLLLRTISVLATSTVFGGIAAVLGLSHRGAYAVAWMLPALALTTVALALASFVPTRVAAATTGGVWLVIVAIVTRAATDLTLFGPPSQIAYLVLTAVAGAVVLQRRQSFDVAGAAV